SLGPWTQPLMRGPQLVSALSTLTRARNLAKESGDSVDAMIGTKIGFSPPLFLAGQMLSPQASSWAAAATWTPEYGGVGALVRSGGARAGVEAVGGGGR